MSKKEENIFWNEKKFNIILLLNNTFTAITKNYYIHFVLYSLVAFLIPFIFKHPQYLVGTVVNLMLILGAFNLKLKELIPLIIFPSIGALLNGLLFGPFTIFLVYFIPFIWVGNLILILVYKYFLKKLEKRRKNVVYHLKIITLSSFFKALFLFIIAIIFVSLKIVPKLFLIAMGINQFITAFSAGFIFMLGFNIVNFIRK